MNIHGNKNLIIFNLCKSIARRSDATFVFFYVKKCHTFSFFSHSFFSGKGNPELVELKSVLLEDKIL